MEGLPRFSSRKENLITRFEAKKLGINGWTGLVWPRKSNEQLGPQTWRNIELFAAK